ncbi:hypothetical protein AOLI_G00056620 [Acnodon oligacanthus]
MSTAAPAAPAQRPVFPSLLQVTPPAAAAAAYALGLNRENGGRVRRNERLKPRGALGVCVRGWLSGLSGQTSGLRSVCPPRGSEFRLKRPFRLGYRCYVEARLG